MRRLLPAAGLFCALITACGTTPPAGIGDQPRAALLSPIQETRSALAQGDLSGAREAIGRLRGAMSAAGAGIDPRDRRVLISGIAIISSHLAAMETARSESAVTAPPPEPRAPKPRPAPSTQHHGKKDHKKHPDKHGHKGAEGGD
jgi:hypothetical protein